MQGTEIPPGEKEVGVSGAGLQGSGKENRKDIWPLRPGQRCRPELFARLGESLLHDLSG